MRKRILALSFCLRPLWRRRHRLRGGQRLHPVVSRAMPTAGRTAWCVTQRRASTARCAPFQGASGVRRPGASFPPWSESQPREGACLTLLSGAATVRISSGAFLNVTVGGEALNGKRQPNQIYIVCEGGSATVTAFGVRPACRRRSYPSRPNIVFSDVA